MKNIKLVLVLLLVCVMSVSAAEYQIFGTTDKDVAIYKPGEEITFTLKVLEDGKPVAGKKITWTRDGDDGKKDKGEGIVDVNGLKITTTMDKPGFVRIQAKAFGEDGKPLQGFKGGWGGNKTGNIFFDGGACVEPEKLESITEPDDFEEFWKGMKAKLDEVPIKAERKELKSKNPKVKLYAVTLDCAGPKPVTGYLTIPANAKPKSKKAIVSFHGYGVRKHNPPGWLNQWAITFDVNAHGMELGKDDAYYKQLQKDLKSYCFNKEENKDREKTYYYGMALRVMRALQYVKTLPEWNGKVLEANGGSQGGLQSLWAAGLDADVTSSSIWSPWCCDFGGITVGRMRGWRPDYNKQLDYYDPVFHAKRSKGKIHLIANLGDYTCPPSSVWIVYNNIPHENKSMEVKQGCTHSYAMKKHMKFTITPKGTKDAGFAKK